MYFEHVLNSGGEGRNTILHPKIDTVVNTIDTITSIQIIESLDVAEVNPINFRILGVNWGNYISLWGGALYFVDMDFLLFNVSLPGNTGINIVQHSSNTKKTVVNCCRWDDLPAEKNGILQQPEIIHLSLEAISLY